MKSKDFHEIIRDTNACDNKAMAESLRADNPELFIDHKTTRTSNLRKVKKRVAIFVPLVAAVCLVAVLVPSILLTQNITNESGNYYCYSGDYDIYFCDKTLKEFSIESGNKILYFDWYDIGTDCVTSEYKLKTTGATVCMNESIYNMEREDYVDLYVSPSKYILDKFTVVIDNSNKMMTPNNNTIKYYTDTESSFGIFTYGSYTYYLKLMYNTDMQRLCSLVDELIPD